MNIFRHIALWVFGSMVLLGLAGGAAVQAATFKIATLSPDGSDWMKALRASGKEIATRTNGEVKFKFYPGGVMGDDKAVLRKIRVGQLHGAVVTSGALIQLYPDIQLYNLPMMFRSLEEVDYVRKRMDKELLAGLEKNGQVGFGIAEVGFAYAMGKSAVTSVTQARSQKVWAPDNDPGAILALDAFGISPITLPLADVLTGLQTGLINAVAGPPVGAIALQWHTQVDHGLELPLLYIYGLLSVSDRAFSRLSPEHQNIVRQVMTDAVAKVNTHSRADHNSAKSALTNQGMHWHQVSVAEREEWQRSAQEATTKLVSSGQVSEPIYDSLLEHLATFRAGGSDTGS